MAYLDQHASLQWELAPVNFIRGGDSYTMKYTPHIIAAIAVAVVATAALATTSNDNITFEIKVNNASIKNIGSEFWFSSSDTIKVTASEPVDWRYLVYNDNMEVIHQLDITKDTLQLDTSKIGMHLIYWSATYADGTNHVGGVLTKIHIIPPADRG